MAESRFVYVVYIRAAPEKVWEALTDPEINKKFWGGYHQKTSWKVGDAFRIDGPDGRTWDTGKVLAFEPPRRIEVTWMHETDEAMKAEGASKMSFTLEPQQGGQTKLTVDHSIGIANSKLIDAVSHGWPHLMSSLKSLLETGQALGSP
jgi:uncharacterized protein YndB with AHSA1/START domain